MLNIKLIREKTEWVKDRLHTRGEDYDSTIDTILKLDSELRKNITDFEKFKYEKNLVSKEMMTFVKQGRGESKKQEMRQLGEKIARLDREMMRLKKRLMKHMMSLPNLPHPSVQFGKSEKDNCIIREYEKRKDEKNHEKKHEKNHTFQYENHITLCNRLGLIDFKRAVKLSGSGFLLYTNWGARLERALIQFLLDLHTSKHRYKEVSPPFMVNVECMEGVGQFPKFIDQAYAVKKEKSDMYLIPTAEAPVANIHREEILNYDDLPIYYCAYSPCFRSEAGAAGVGTRGMIRVHQFDKVELIKIVSPESGYDELEAMLCDAEKVLQLLDLHYRIVLLSTGDMSFASSKTYDIEVWAPGQASYLEVSSCSNCEDFQSRRMNLRCKTKDGKRVFPHILNGSGVALSRLFVALIETHQQEDGSIYIPKPLQPYMKAERIPVT